MLDHFFGREKQTGHRSTVAGRTDRLGCCCKSEYRAFGLTGLVLQFKTYKFLAVPTRRIGPLYGAHHPFKPRAEPTNNYTSNSIKQPFVRV
jgi:hypothetical protein